MKAVLVMSVLCSFLMSTATFARSKACTGVADARSAKALAGSSGGSSVDKTVLQSVVK